MSDFGCSWAAIVPHARPSAIIITPRAFMGSPILKPPVPSPPDSADISDAETGNFVHLTLME
jgi:hypothetical protein